MARDPYRIQIMDARYIDARAERERVMAPYDRNVLQAKNALLREIAIYYDISMRAVALGPWDCPASPTEMCIYNSDKDPSHDACIVCGQPEERK
jgi:hypothetical protein